MNLHAIGVVYRKEFTEWVRDRRTLISTVIVPLLLFPIIMVGFSALAVVLVGKAQKETPKVMILGGEDSPQLLANLRKLDNLEIAPYTSNGKSKTPKKKFAPPSRFPRDFNPLSRRVTRKPSRSTTTRAN